MSKISYHDLKRQTLKRFRFFGSGRYVHLTKQGHYLQGLSPFHLEKTPSFNIAPEKQIYKCYGCRAGGNAIQYPMGVEGYTFVEAVKELAKETGVPLGIDENT
ncbi:hypothetical protein FE784_11970 [Paenibacillus hemerocallicola]|uniref:Zinc finger CHC2-type domain-containing protein n=1 Tax=Paenibacillus hemerocallicola TaxID=1172614 RepID=A0A5C4TCB7_9BACL|nr:hypothetical protein FE784_11970 [Paenibacillus hemerocallicola]